MRSKYVLAGIVTMTIGLGAISTGSAFAMGCLSPEVATPPVSLANTPMGDMSDHGAWSKGFGYDRDAYLAALARGNACGTSQQSQPLAATELPAHHRQSSQSAYN